MQIMLLQEANLLWHKHISSCFLQIPAFIYSSMHWDWDWLQSETSNWTHILTSPKESWTPPRHNRQHGCSNTSFTRLEATFLIQASCWLTRQLMLTVNRLKMSSTNSCQVNDLRVYQHQVYAVVYSVILAPGLLGNVLALWVFRAYVKETKKAVVFMMNLAVADLLQVKIPSCLWFFISDY